MQIQAVRGMKDTLPSETPLWQKVESILIQKVMGCGYQEIRLPIVEKTDIFKRSIGEVTDIVAKEMYTFLDRNGDSLSLRPEGTASCVRAALENGLLYNQTQRLWYMGPMFRHERPQKGRYRQFTQLGVEAFGWQGPDLDIEQLMMIHSFWKALSLEHSISLEINSLGTPSERKAHRSALVEYLKSHASVLNEEARNRLETNPLRILDSKDPQMQEIIKDAPSLLTYLQEDSLKFFETIQSMLNAANIPFKINPRLVRGLDYYCHTVFEWITKDLGAQGTVCGGGRYDGLVELFGGKPMPAVGFALGLDRIIALLLDKNYLSSTPIDIYMISVGEQAARQALLVANSLRDFDLKVIYNAGGGNFKKQFERANKSGAQYAFIIGESELNKGIVSIKCLRENSIQKEIPLKKLIESVKDYRKIQLERENISLFKHLESNFEKDELDSQA